MSSGASKSNRDRESASESASEVDHVPGLEHSLFAEVQEDCYVIDDVTGELPHSIRGTYYVIGPANFRVGNLQYNNWLDGDGMVCALRFGDGFVCYVSKFVQSKKWKEENKAGQALYGTFGTRFPGAKMRRKIATEPPYNVNVIRYRNRLLAFGEQSIPIELDPVTLETVGEFDFDRQVNSISPFSAHPKVDAVTGECLNFGISFSGTSPCANYYRFDAEGKLACRKRIPIDYASSIHDFAVSQNYVAIYLSPYILDMLRILNDDCSLLDALDWKPEFGSSLLILDRVDGSLVANVPVGNRYCLHTADCVDRGRELVFDCIELERPVYDEYQLTSMFCSAPVGQLVRLVIDLESGSLTERREFCPTSLPDFPCIDGKNGSQPCSDVWMLDMEAAGKPGRKFFNQLVRCNWLTMERSYYQPPAGKFLGAEPVFVANNDEQGGWIIVQEMDSTSRTSEFVILDAYDIPAGPVCRLRLRHPSHFGFHAMYDPAATTARHAISY